VLKVDSHGYSSAILTKIVTAGGQLKSFDLAAQMLEKLAEFQISARHLGRLTEEIGAELCAQRDQQAAALPPERTRAQRPGTAPEAVAVEVDGGRMHMRTEGQGPGVHQPHWKEDKIACLVTLESRSFATDPHPEPPRCFLDRKRVYRLVREISSQRGTTAEADGEAVVLPAGVVSDTDEATPAKDAASAEADVAVEFPCSVPVSERAVPLPQTNPFEVCVRVPVVRVPASALGRAPTTTPPPATTTPPPATTTPPPTEPQGIPKWHPQRRLRTCVATLGDSEAFGKLVANEAYQRNFYAARRRAFVADGQKYNWAIHARHFPDYVAIADFAHVLTYVFAAAYAVGGDGEERWGRYVRWMTACWQGHVLEVVDELAAWESQQARLKPGVKLAASDPREIVRKTLTYLRNNQGRMDYPRYRREGLPCMSAWMESLVKEFNYRVKGSEKFWNPGCNGENILQARAAVLSEDGRLENHVRRRPGSAFRRYRKKRNCVKVAA
jgi:hypothetical protein